MAEIFQIMANHRFWGYEQRNGRGIEFQLNVCGEPSIEDVETTQAKTTAFTDAAEPSTESIVFPRRSILAFVDLFLLNHQNAKTL